MKRRIPFTVAGAVGAGAVAVALAVSWIIPAVAVGTDASPVASKNQRQYRCTKCRQVYTFDRPGNYKCSKCNKPLIPVT